MLILRGESTDPFYNLALEEYLTTSNQYKEPILFLWQNNNTIVVGRNQNPASEISLVKATSDNVAIVRRNTGGGTVFHDLGNLNFSIIYTDTDNTGVYLFEKMLTPVISTLNNLNVPAIFSGRNDIVLNGKKISGNAMWKYKDRFLQHGTILFNANLEKLAKYLTVDRAKILSKNIESISSRVTNINSEIEKPILIPQFIEELIKTYQKEKTTNILSLTPDDILKVKELRDAKYADPDWTFKKNTTFTFQNKARLEGKGSFEILIDVQEGVIQEIAIFGDFLGFGGTEELEKKLVGTEYNSTSITNVLKNFDLKLIFGTSIEIKDILDLLIQ